MNVENSLSEPRSSDVSSNPGFTKKLDGKIMAEKQHE